MVSFSVAGGIQPPAPCSSPSSLCTTADPSVARPWAIAPQPEQENSPSLQLKLTLAGADTTPQVVGTFTKFDLAGGPYYNIVQFSRGGRGLMSGYVNYVEIKDAASGELLLAYMVEQYPNAMNVGATFGSMSAAETGVGKGVEQLLEKLH